MSLKFISFIYQQNPSLASKNKRISSLVGHVDILPTLLDLVGVSSPSDIDGKSMLPLIEGTTDSIRKVVIASGGAAPPKGELPGAVIAPPWTLLIHEGGCDDKEGRRLLRENNKNARCLYNLQKNPEQDVLETMTESEKVKELNAVWQYFMKRRFKKGKKVDLDPTFVEELRRSGYDFR